MRLKIYQIDADKDPMLLRFMGGAYLQQTLGTFRVDPAMYLCVYDGDLPATCLNDVYLICNMDLRPRGYQGRSLSISDVIAVLQSDTVTPGYYFCDELGFRKIEFDASLASTASGA